MNVFFRWFGAKHELTFWYERLSRFFLLATVFLVPITVFPWTVDTHEINKQTILLVGVILSALFWLGARLVEKRFSWRISMACIFALLFLGSTVLASVFSLAPYTSWIGSSGQEYTSFFSIFGYVVFFLLTGRLLGERNGFKAVLQVGLSAASIVGLLAVLEIFGLGLLNGNLIGTPSALGLYLAVWAITASAFLLFFRADEFRSRRGFAGFYWRASSWLIILSALVVLSVIDYFVLWIVFIAGAILLLILFLRQLKDATNMRLVALPVGLLGIALVLLFFPAVLPSVYPGEIAPSYSASARIARQTLEGGLWLFGSGPGTFVAQYDLYKSPVINQTALWDTHFDRSASHILTQLATFGIFGTLVYLGFILGIVILLGRVLLADKSSAAAGIVAAPWLMLALSQWVYSSNLTLLFTFWLFSGVILAIGVVKERTIDFSAAPKIAFATISAFVLLSVGFVTLLFISFSRYGAEVAFARAVATDQSGGSIDVVIADLETATHLNKLSDVYARNLANAYLLKTAELLKEETTAPALISEYISGSILEAKRATELAPYYVVNWALLGDVYREFAPLILEADFFAVEAYKKTIELSPTNPLYPTALGRAYLVQADNFSVLLASDDSEKIRAEYNLALKSAGEQLETALILKPDYAPAKYYLSLVYQRQGNITEAILKMQATKEAAPYDVGVKLQLGLLYLQQGRIQSAQDELEEAVVLAPNFANARWYLASVYEQQGKIEQAIEQIEQILHYDSTNSSVIQRLEKLQAGLVEEEVPEPLEE